MVVLEPSASRNYQYRDSTQEFDQVALFKPITKASFPINKIERLPDALRQAFRVATSGKMGPALVDIPRDLLLEALQVDGPSIIEIPTDPEEIPRQARLAEVQAPEFR